MKRTKNKPRVGVLAKTGLGLALLGFLVGCGGGGGGDSGSQDPPNWQTALSWDFSSAQAWVLEAADGGHARSEVDAGRLALAAQAYVVDPQGDLTCPLAAATVSLDVPAVTSPNLQALALQFHVQRWDLGLGPFDSDVPQLELVLRGQRYLIGVSGFKQMPGVVRFEWTAAGGLVSSYDGVVSGLPAQVSADSRPDMVKLSIDGCSEGGAQTLEIDSAEVLTR